MTMGGAEINRRGGLIADTTAGMLAVDGIRDSVVVVTHDYAFDLPIAIRTPEGFGYGANTEAFYSMFQELGRRARQQAKYAMRAGGRSASEQEAKLRSLGRSASSYGADFPPGLEAAFAHDKSSGLTVVTLSRSLSNLAAAKYSERAVTDVDDGKEPRHVLEAAEFVNACLGIITRDLPGDRTGFVMVALPVYRANTFDYSDNSPAVVCSQAGGQVVSPSNYAIVEAKAKAVATTGRASGPSSTQLYEASSQIVGGLPISIQGLGERVVAAGGLMNGEDDVAAIIGALEVLPVQMLRISVIEESTG